MAITNVQVSAGTTASVPLNSNNSSSVAQVGSNSTITVTNGTSTGQANLVYYPKNVSITTGTPWTFDLRGTTTIFTDDGLLASFSVITSLTIKHLGTTGTITVGGGTNPLFPSGMPPINPGGRFHIDDTGVGIAITNATNDLLQVATSGTAVSVEITISGRA